jgi:hypothetical protein
MDLDVERARRRLFQLVLEDGQHPGVPVRLHRRRRDAQPDGISGEGRADTDEFDGGKPKGGNSRHGGDFGESHGFFLRCSDENSDFAFFGDSAS